MIGEKQSNGISRVKLERSLWWKFYRKSSVDSISTQHQVSHTRWLPQLEAGGAKQQECRAAHVTGVTANLILSLDWSTSGEQCYYIIPRRESTLPSSHPPTRVLRYYQGWITMLIRWIEPVKVLVCTGNFIAEINLSLSSRVGWGVRHLPRPMKSFSPLCSPLSHVHGLNWQLAATSSRIRQHLGSLQSFGRLRRLTVLMMNAGGLYSLWDSAPAQQGVKLSWVSGQSCEYLEWITVEFHAHPEDSINTLCGSCAGVWYAATVSLSWVWEEVKLWSHCRPDHFLFPA